MHRSQIKVNPNLIMVPLTPITYTSAQLHETIIIFIIIIIITAFLSAFFQKIKKVHD